MNKLFAICTLISLLLPVSLLKAQYEVVEYDFQNAYFNQGQALPAESKLIITGNMPIQADRIEISLYKAGSNAEKAPLYLAVWDRAPGDQSASFRLPFPFSLRGNTDFDFYFDFYRKLTPLQQQKLEKEIHEAMSVYWMKAFQLQGYRLKLTNTAKALSKDLNKLVTGKLEPYRWTSGQSFDGFSDLVEAAIAEVDGTLLPMKSKADSVRVQHAQKLNAELVKGHPQLIQLQAILRQELAPIMSHTLMEKKETRQVKDYSTEKSRSALALNLGYGGVYFGGEFDNISYDAAPYVGISLPLANRAFAPRILANTSLSVGVFTSNFENDEGQVVTGPIFGRPYFVGVGYNIIRFIKINAGLTALETQGNSNVGGGTVSIDVNAVEIKPFLGLSVELDLWLGLRERR